MLLVGRMSEYPYIESAVNSRVKNAVKLRERKFRQEQQLFLIEGYRELLRAEQANYPIKELYTCPEFFLGEEEQELARRLESKGVSLFHFSKKAFEKAAYRQHPGGLLAVAEMRHCNFSSLEKRFSGRPPFLLIAEGVEKPGNLGTILRSSDACGLDGVLLCDRKTDIFNPNVVRASVGTIFHVPVVETDNEAALKWLHKQGIRILAATPAADHLYTHVDMKDSVAIAVGTEKEGLSDFWMENADYKMKIPMKGFSDSLNVSMAATLMLYEAVRQRCAR
jgi:TrmH family RNA methyltransferase